MSCDPPALLLGLSLGAGDTLALGDFCCEMLSAFSVLYDI